MASRGYEAPEGAPGALRLDRTRLLAESVTSRLTQLERIISGLSRENAELRDRDERLSREREQLIAIVDRAEILRQEYTDLLARSHDDTRRLQGAERAVVEHEAETRALADRCAQVEASLAEESAGRRAAEHEIAVLIEVIGELRAIVELSTGAGGQTPNP